MSLAPSCAGFALGILLTSWCCALAQVEWVRTQLAGPRANFAMAYDAARDRVVVFGGEGHRPGTALNDTWEWDGAGWQQRTPSSSPPPRSWAVMAYDTTRQRCVLFGGRDASGALDDTWEWDGSDWTLRQPTVAPSPVGQWGMAHDPHRGVTVLAGGGETWEWDGNDWLQRISGSPLPTALCALTYDPIRRRVLATVFENVTAPQQVWEWDGANWSLLAATTGPLARWGAVFAFDPLRGRAVLFGGNLASKGGVLLDDTWEWDGSAWTSLPTAVMPAARSMAGAVWHPRRGTVLVFGGAEKSFTSGSKSKHGDLWEWNGTQWSQLSAGVVPPLRGGHAICEDSVRGRIVLFGGESARGDLLDDTWEWHGAAAIWSLRRPAQSPPARCETALAFDRARGRMVLFGGMGPQGELADTWEWDGVQWQQRQPQTSPPARRRHALGYHGPSGRVVMFGGESGTLQLGDTWEWDGRDWVQRGNGYPPAAATPLLAENLLRNRLTMVAVATWEWDGNGWSQRASKHVPPPLRGLCFDRARGREVGVGAFDPPTGWEWDGADWVARPLGDAPFAVDAADALPIAYDAALGHVVHWGGGTTRFDGAMWLYRPQHLASYAPFGVGCAGAGGVPALAARGEQRPWLGDVQVLDVGRVPASASVALLVGASRQRWMTVALPLDLGLLGMPGCPLLVSGEVVLPAVAQGGVATFSLPIPNQAALLGGRFFDQAIVRDATANGLGLSVSNGGAGVIGAR